MSRHDLRTLHSNGFVRPVLRSVYVASQVPDDMWLRARALALVLPPEAVVTDRTAAWLHGVNVLPRTSRDSVPPVEAFHTADTRMARAGVASGRRGLLPSDVTVIHGIRTTTALRTALDLGRLLWRFDALGALDGFLRIGVPHEAMVDQLDRFKGFRGVIQLRHLVPLADGRSESMGESALRLHWHDAGLPWPELQVWVYDDDGTPIYRLDIALLDPLYAAEYDGEENHSSDEDKEHDLERREWCSAQRGWHFEVFTKKEVYRREPDPLPILRGGLTEARRNERWTPYGGPMPAATTRLWTP
ncbi:MAG: hypothetical protein JOZ82_09060 [Marmoricola sp.]|nr:hypothetical protein [Marmoricola sp.]